MQKLTTSDLWPLPAYEAIRDDFRRGVIEAKKARRVHVGPYFTFVFENRLTVKFQVMEILRAEKVTAPDHIAEELEGFNTMLPTPGALSATLMIELVMPEEQAKATLATLSGIGRHVWLEVDGQRVAGELDGGRDDGARVSAVQYVRFELGALAKTFAKGKVRLVVDHPNYQHAVELDAASQQSLAADLEAS